VKGPNFSTRPPVNEGPNASDVCSKQRFATQIGRVLLCYAARVALDRAKMQVGDKLVNLLPGTRRPTGPVLKRALRRLPEA
jgi:hypothetical protein